MILSLVYMHNLHPGANLLPGAKLHPGVNLLPLKPLSHWTATVLRQLATDIASGSPSSLETVASDS